jgi:5-methylcytosine-specific restriction endonuclease McrA
VSKNKARRRMMLWKLQDLRCAGCGERAWPHLGKRNPKVLTIDEVVPRSKGGMRVLGNQLAMHKHCNEAKADRMPNGCELIWLEMVGAKLRAKGMLG